MVNKFAIVIYYSYIYTIINQHINANMKTKDLQNQILENPQIAGLTLHPLHLHTEENMCNCFEVVLENGEILSINDLKELNANGYVYHSEQTDVDFEDEYENGGVRIGYMNIYYFSKASVDIHNDQEIF